MLGCNHQNNQSSSTRAVSPRILDALAELSTTNQTKDLAALKLLLEELGILCKNGIGTVNCTGKTADLGAIRIAVVSSTPNTRTVQHQSVLEISILLPDKSRSDVASISKKLQLRWTTSKSPALEHVGVHSPDCPTAFELNGKDGVNLALASVLPRRLNIDYCRSPVAQIDISINSLDK